MHLGSCRGRGAKPYVALSKRLVNGMLEIPSTSLDCVRGQLATTAQHQECGLAHPLVQGPVCGFLIGYDGSASGPSENAPTAAKWGSSRGFPTDSTVKFRSSAQTIGPSDVLTLYSLL